MIKKGCKERIIFTLIIFILILFIYVLTINFNLISAVEIGTGSECCQIEPHPPRCGDTNGDRRLDESDLDAITSYAFEGVEIPEGVKADLNADGVVDILDVVTMTNYVKRNGAAPRCGVVINEPQVWMCDDRIVWDDDTEPGRISEGGEPLIERMNNYLFEGEQIHWDVLVYNEKGIENITGVYVTIGDVQGEGNEIEVNCIKTSDIGFESCGARILEEELEWNPELMAYYSCTLTVETPESMYGEYWVTVEAQNVEGYAGTMDENEYWWFNPEISLSVNDSINFENLFAGETAYSNYISVKSAVDESSGVRLDMFISGTDFYSSNNQDYCPENRKLGLEQFRYYAENGAYNTTNISNSDWEGYMSINYGIGFNNPLPFYDNYEIIPKDYRYAPYYMANILSPNGEMQVRFKLNIPRDCNGTFDSGAIYFWAEAI